MINYFKKSFVKWGLFMNDLRNDEHSGKHCFYDQMGLQEL